MPGTAPYGAVLGPRMTSAFPCQLQTIRRRSAARFHPERMRALDTSNYISQGEDDTHKILDFRSRAKLKNSLFL